MSFLPIVRAEEYGMAQQADQGNQEDGSEEELPPVVTSPKLDQSQRTDHVLQAEQQEKDEPQMDLLESVFSNIQALIQSLHDAIMTKENHIELPNADYRTASRATFVEPSGFAELISDPTSRLVLRLATTVVMATGGVTAMSYMQNLPSEKPILQHDSGVDTDRALDASMAPVSSVLENAHGICWADPAQAPHCNFPAIYFQQSRPFCNPETSLQAVSYAPHQKFVTYFDHNGSQFQVETFVEGN